MTRRTKTPTDPHLQLARQLIKYHFPKKSISITRLAGGITNSVYLAKAGKEELVVRINDDREKINFFLKEQWAVARAREKKIPVPEILEVGNDIIPLPYMILRKIEGEEATHHTARREIIREMGQYAAMIHSIPTKGYGHMFDWSQNTLSKNETWKDYLDCELKINERMGILKKHKMLPAKTASRIIAELGKIKKWDHPPCLHHGDLRLKNTMVNKEGKIVAIIDWENCISMPSHYWDTSISLHDLSIDAQWSYLEGYGIQAKELIEMAPVLKVFNLLNYAPVIDKMAREKQKETLAHYRARLHGAMDMYSL